MPTKGEINIMTEFNNNLKFVPQAPQIYEVRYIENKDQSNLSRFASYLGISQAHCNPEGDNSGGSGNGSGSGGNGDSGGSAHTQQADPNVSKSAYQAKSSYEKRVSADEISECTIL